MSAIRIPTSAKFSYVSANLSIERKEKTKIMNKWPFYKSLERCFKSTFVVSKICVLVMMCGSRCFGEVVRAVAYHRKGTGFDSRSFTDVLSFLGHEEFGINLDPNNSKWNSSMSKVDRKKFIYYRPTGEWKVFGEKVII